MKRLKPNRIRLALALMLVFSTLFLHGCGNAVNSDADTVNEYIHYLGKSNSDEGISLPKDLYEKTDEVVFMGREGTVEYGVSLAMRLHYKGDIADELIWTMNERVDDQDEFMKYVAMANEYFGHEAEEKPVGHQWKDRHNNCIVTASYDYGEVSFSWRQLPEDE